jgi:hypothetical protein
MTPRFLGEGEFTPLVRGLLPPSPMYPLYLDVGLELVGYPCSSRRAGIVTYICVKGKNQHSIIFEYAVLELIQGRSFRIGDFSWTVLRYKI